MDSSKFKRYLPHQKSDWFAMGFALVITHGVVLFELLVILPTIDPEYSGHYYAHLIIGIFLYLNVITHYFMMICYDSGCQGILLPYLLKPGWKFCAVCEANCPPRAKHCNSCNVCVLERDHHCTFGGKCIGHRNMRYFFFLLLYYVLGSSYCVFLNMDYIFDILHGWSWRAIVSMFIPSLAWILGLMPHGSLLPCAMCTLCIVGCLYVTAVFVYHFRNLMSGQTTSEASHKNFEYSQSCDKNINHRLGKNWRYAWICAFIKSPLPTDGMTPITNKELNM